MKGVFNVSNIQAALFGTVPKNDYFHFFENDKKIGSQIQPKKVIDFLNFTKNDVAAATDKPASSVRYDEKMPDELKERITEWAIAINLVGSFFNDHHKTMMWFQVSNPLLGNMTPRDMIRIGRFKRLMRFIQTALDENKKA